MKATYRLTLGISGFLGALVLNTGTAAGSSLYSSIKPNVTQDNPLKISTEGTDIVGGVPSQGNTYIAETVVSVYDGSQDVLCSGVIISDNIVVTAAHCLGENPQDIENPQDMVVVFGLEFESSVQLKVDKAEPSPYWKSSNEIPGDIALVHFVGKIPAGFRAASMVSSTNFLQVGTPVVLAGYGIDNEDAKTGAGILRLANAKIENPTYDQSEIEVDQTAGAGACEGDSGGPGYAQISGKYYLWGITNGGLSASCHGYSVYTNISFYILWIQNTAVKLSTSVTSQYFQ